MTDTLSLPNLPYSYEALEPAISREIMEIHHKKHHAAYVANYNAALEKYKAAALSEDLPAQIALFQSMKFNGGGHINHTLFWENLAPIASGGGQFPAESPLGKKIISTYGSFEAFQEQFNAKALLLQGSGWVWLGLNPALKTIEIAACENQDPLSTKGLIPLLGVDVWEHAYYLQYKNVRAEYVKAIWTVINWNTVAKRYATVS